MKYVCNCQSLKLKSGKTVRFGDPVPDAETWPSNVLKANLRLGYIREDQPKKTSGGQPVETRVATTVLSPAQMERRNAAPEWLRKEAEKGRVLQTVPPQANDVPTTAAPEGGVSISPGQGPSSSAASDLDSGGQPGGDSDTAEESPAPESNRQPQRQHHKKRGR